MYCVIFYLHEKVDQTFDCFTTKNLLKHETKTTAFYFVNLGF